MFPVSLVNVVLSFVHTNTRTHTLAHAPARAALVSFLGAVTKGPGGSGA